MVLSVCLWLPDTATAQFAGGPGSEGNPYQSATLDDSFDDRFFLGGLDGWLSVSEVHHDSLYIGGSFKWIDGQTQLNRIGRWNGTTLKPVGDGFNGSVEVLKSIDGVLYAGGNFTRSGETTVNRIARFNDDTRKWEPVGEGFNNSVRTLAAYHGDIVAGGYFSMSGDEPVDHVARWDGENWQPMGDGFNSRVLALKKYGDTLVAGGEFRLSGDRSIYRMARWDGENWHDTGADLIGFPEEMGEVTPPIVSDITLFDDYLAIGGIFYGKSYQDENYISKIGIWDGEKWYRPAVEQSFRSVSAVVEYQGNLIAGDAHRGKDESVFRLNMEDEEWETMGEQFAYVDALTVFNGHLYAAGGYHDENGEVRYRIARWDEDHWKPINGVFNCDIRKLYVHDGQLYAAGHFTEIDGEPAQRIARWNGTRWETFDHRINGSVRALAYVGEDLYLGGSFNTINNKASHNLARWKKVPTSAEYTEDEYHYHSKHPEKFRLLPNHPNPFNPATQIRFTLPEPAHVNLTVYDLLGQRVATLVDETRSAGRHDVTFDATGLSSGVFIYRIEAGEYVETRQMMFVK